MSIAGVGSWVPPSAIAGDSNAKPNPAAAASAFNAKTFGAKGDGATDDTEAVKASLAACNAAGGGTVYFPPGNYVISSTILVNYNDIAIVGAGWGSTIFVPRQKDGDVFVFGDKLHCPRYHKMADFSIRPAGPMTSGALIHVQNSNHIILSGFAIDGGFRGVSIDDFSLQTGVHLCDFIIQNARDAAILIGQDSPPPYQPNEIFLTNGTISQCRYGLALVYVDGLYASAVSIYRSAEAGMLFAPTAKTVVSDCIFVNCLTDSTLTGSGFQFAGEPEGIISNIVLSNCISSMNRHSALRVLPKSRVNGLQVRGGICQLSRESGISVESTIAKNISILGMQVGFNSWDNPGKHPGMYFAPGVGNFTVEGCTIGFVGTHTSVAKNGQTWGIVVAPGDADGYIIANNRCVANLAGGVQDGGSAKNKSVTGNLTLP